MIAVEIASVVFAAAHHYHCLLVALSGVSSVVLWWGGVAWEIAPAWLPWPAVRRLIALAADLVDGLAGDRGIDLAGAASSPVAMVAGEIGLVVGVAGPW
ncbi:MAG: hypothetical protein QM529_00435 [Hydrotalea sp.]|nr:hypothetical protein [Hydrotalea sp.]